MMCVQACVAVLRGFRFLLCVIRGLRLRRARHRCQGHLRLHGDGGSRPARGSDYLIPGVRLIPSVLTTGHCVAETSAT